jgi:hypothetical protein
MDHHRMERGVLALRPGPDTTSTREPWEAHRPELERQRQTLQPMRHELESYSASTGVCADPHLVRSCVEL